MPTIWLGNHAAVEYVPTGEIDDRGEPVKVRTPVEGKHYTIVQPPDDNSVAEIITDLTHPNGVWAAHSDADAPAWVASTDPELTWVLAKLWGCEARVPESLTDQETALAHLAKALEG